MTVAEIGRLVLGRREVKSAYASQETVRGVPPDISARLGPAGDMSGNTSGASKATGTVWAGKDAPTAIEASDEFAGSGPDKQSSVRGAILRHLGRVLLGTGVGWAENAAYMPSPDAKTNPAAANVADRAKKINMMVSIASVYGMTHSPAAFRAVLPGYPMKALAAYGAGEWATGNAADRENLAALTAKNMEVARRQAAAAGSLRAAGTEISRTARSSEKATRKGSRNALMAAGILSAGMLGAAGMHAMRMRKDVGGRKGSISVTLPTSRPDTESKVDIPLSVLPNETYKAVLRDTRRRLRQEAEERKRRKAVPGSAVPQIEAGASLYDAAVA
jgi:hypothetical protein